jgi:hypothetical protein
MTPTGSPSGVVRNGKETAGIPVRFQADVQGVKAFWFSKSRAGSASSRISPIRSGGWASVGVRTAS